MAQGKFTAQVRGFGEKTKALQEAVFRESVQRTIEITQRPVGAGGNMPVDTGFLRASLTATIGGGVPALRPKPQGDATHTYDVGQISLVIASASINDTITAAYAANYARFAHYGARGRPGRMFVSLAAQQWQRTVSEVAEEAKARSR